MAENTKIEWAEHTWSPWRGCEKVPGHPACDHCYAAAMAPRNPTVLGAWGSEAAGGRRVMAAEKYWKAPLRWNRDAAASGTRPKVFVNSISDFFEDWQGPIHDHRGEKLEEDGLAYPRRVLTMADVRRQAFRVIDSCPNVDFLLLTKRPENVVKMWFDPDSLNGFPYRKNVWLGTSISDQATADEFVPRLLKCRDLAPVLFLSIEPLLGPIDLRKSIALALGKSWPPSTDGFVSCMESGPIHESDLLSWIDWVIVGGESGHHARPMHHDWVRAIRDQCKGAGVPFFFKQWGEWIPQCQLTTAQDHEAFHYSTKRVKLDDDRLAYWLGKKYAGRLLDSREWNEYPQLKTVN